MQEFTYSLIDPALNNMDRKLTLNRDGVVHYVGQMLADLFSDQETGMATLKHGEDIEFLIIKMKQDKKENKEE